LEAELSKAKVNGVGVSESQAWWNHLSEEEKNEIRSMPNFRNDIFMRVTGIDASDAAGEALIRRDLP
jgi:hypothetical protein